MLSAWRQWLEGFLQRMRSPTTSDELPKAARSAQERAHFWEEFRAGQRVADERVAAQTRPEPVTP